MGSPIFLGGSLLEAEPLGGVGVHPGAHLSSPCPVSPGVAPCPRQPGSGASPGGDKVSGPGRDTQSPASPAWGHGDHPGAGAVALGTCPERSFGLWGTAGARDKMVTRTPWGWPKLGPRHLWGLSSVWGGPAGPGDPLGKPQRERSRGRPRLPQLVSPLRWRGHEPVPVAAVTARVTAVSPRPRHGAGRGHSAPKPPQNPPPPTRGTPEQRTRGWGTKPHPPTVSPCHLRDPPKQQLGHPKGSGTPKDPPHGPQTPPGTPPKFIWCPPRAQEPPMDPPARGGTMGPPPLDPDRASPTPPLCADSAIPAGAARTRG